MNRAKKNEQKYDPDFIWHQNITVRAANCIFLVYGDYGPNKKCAFSFYGENPIQYKANNKWPLRKIDFKNASEFDVAMVLKDDISNERLWLPSIPQCGKATQNNIMAWAFGDTRFLSKK